MAYGWKMGPIAATRADGLGRAHRPAAPASLTATALSPSEVAVEWTASASGYVGGYLLERGTDGETYTQVADLHPATTAYTDTGLTADTLYHYRVRPYNDAETGAGASDTATTQAGGGGGLTVTSVALTDYVSGTTLMTLTDGATIDPAALGTSHFQVVATGSTGTESVAFYADSGAIDRYENGAPYEMAVGGWQPAAGAHAIDITPYPQDDKGGAAGTTLELDVTIATVSAPTAPTGLTAVADGSTRVLLSWTPGAGGGTPETFRVERAPDSGGSPGAWAEIGSSATNAYTASGLTRTTTYHFRVRARNNGGDSAYSNTDSATTDDTPPTQWPDETNTGTSGVLQDMAGGASVTSAWAAANADSGTGTALDPWVIENREVSGTVTIWTSNVTLRNCLVNGTGNYNFLCDKSDGAGNKFTNIVIEDCELTGSAGAAVYGWNWTMRRCYVHDHQADGCKPRDNCTIEQSYFTRIGLSSSAHADVFQISGGTNIAITGNNVDSPAGAPGLDTDVLIFMNSAFDDIGDITIDGNRFNGSTNEIFHLDALAEGGGPSVGTVTFSNNVVGVDYTGLVGRTWGNVVQAGNTWEDDGSEFDIGS